MESPPDQRPQLRQRRLRVPQLYAHHHQVHRTDVTGVIRRANALQMKRLRAALDTKPAIDPPAAPLAPDEAAVVISRFGASRSIALLDKIIIPVGGRPVALPFPIPDEKKEGGEKKGK